MKLATVADSACLIGLERIGRLEMLRSLFVSLYIPPEVDAEFGIKVPWLEVVEYSNTVLFQALRLLMHEGEAAALTLAHEKGIPVILDDRRARNAARKIGLTVTGTVGVILRAKQAGILSHIRPVITDLEEAGFYLDDTLRNGALRLAEE